MTRTYLRENLEPDPGPGAVGRFAAAVRAGHVPETR